jgi:hypothetical protein
MSSFRAHPILLSSLAAIAAACSAGPTTKSVTEDPAPAKAPEVVPPADAAAGSLATPSREQWRRDMSKIAAPTEGCFVATRPSTTWVEVPCTKAPDRPLAPRKGHLGVATVGADYGDFSLLSAVTFIGVTGSFPSVNGVISEQANGVSNAYSLQLNTNPFTPPKLSDGTSICDGADNPSACQGWEQFIYQGAGGGYIQYWLLKYRADGTCPLGWKPGGALAPGDCYRNSLSNARASAAPITDLANLSVRGATSSGLDIIQVTVDETISMTSQKTFLNMNSNVWTTAEFNVFGDSDDHEAIFSTENTGATVVVRIETDGSTTTSVPTCDGVSFTGETNNLNLEPNSCRATAGAIEFTEGNACTPTQCTPNDGIRCGTNVPDGCGFLIPNCGTCAPDSFCQSNNYCAVPQCTTPACKCTLSGGTWDPATHECKTLCPKGEKDCGGFCVPVARPCE